MTSNTEQINPDQTRKQTEVDIYTSIVNRVFHIEDTTWGSAKEGFLVRYRGNLIIDSEIAYEQLSTTLQHHEITPLFRVSDEVQNIILINGIIKPKPSKVWVNLLLFGLTVLSMLYAGTIYSLGGLYDGSASLDLQSLLPYLVEALSGGIAFTVSILAILLAHEFGHYFTARFHKTEVSFPYFIPFPTLFGTMGAVILTKEVPKNKKVLLDIGIAGPLAGLAVTIPIIIYGLATSDIHQLPQTLQQGMGFEGNSILYLGLKYHVHGLWLPQPANFGNLHPLQYWLRYFFTGQPLPIGGIDVTMNSIALAGWAGLLVTGLNLIPIGQLDGGHLLYGIFGRRTEKIVPVILGLLVVMGFFWAGWWLWAALLLLFNRKHGEPLDEITPLDSKRKIIAILGLIVFLLVFIPVPMTTTM